MAGNNFQYIINAKLQLSTGSLNKVLQDIRDVDKSIKSHFEKAGGGVRVPITVDKNTTQLQKEVSRVIEGYNKGQSPTIKIKLDLDNASINRLQQRVSELKKQLNSLSDENKKVNVSTSLVVGKNEEKEIQKQVDGIKPKVEVQLVPSDNSLKEIQETIKSIKADVESTVQNLRRFNSRNLSSPSGSNSRSVGGVTSTVTNRLRQTIGGSKADNFIAGREQLKNELRTLEDMHRLLDQEYKVVSDLDKYKKDIEEKLKKVLGAKKDTSKGFIYLNDNNGKKRKVTPDNYDAEIEGLQGELGKLKQLEQLQKEVTSKKQQISNYDKSYAYGGTSKDTPRSTLPNSHKAVQLGSEIEAEKLRQKQLDDEQKKAQDIAKKAEDKRAKDDERFFDSLERQKSAKKSKTARKQREDAEKAIQKQKNNEDKWMRQAEIGYRRFVVRRQASNQRSYNFDNGIRPYGGNKEYSAKDYEAMLANPNISLADSKKIIEKHLNPYYQKLAVDNQMNFQKGFRVQFKDDEGTLRSINLLTNQYTKFGEVIKRNDKSFGSMMDHMVSKVGIYSILEGALAGVSIAIVKSVEDMTQFDAQLADVIMTTKDLTSQGNQLQAFYNTVGGTKAMESQVQNDTFKNAETYGVSALDTVMPIEQQVIARRNLVAGANGKYDPNVKDQIVQKIMQFSAISTGGNETPEETNKLTQDMMSLYQAYYNPNDPTQHLKKMNQTFDFLTSMKTRGVNSTAVADAMAELAPDTITAGIDGKQVMSMLGSYNLADASATGDDIQTIGRTFFGTLRHASGNDNIKNALMMMGIDLNTTNMSTPDLLNKVLSNYGNLNDAQKEQFAQAFSGTGGNSKAMVPKMVKFLNATQGQDYKSFMNTDSTDAMKNAWIPFSEKLKTNFDGLVEKLQEFVQLIGRLGVLDTLGAVVKTFSSMLSVVNSVLRAVQSLSDQFHGSGMFSGFAIDIPKVTIEILALQGALKGLRKIINSKGWGGAVGDFFAGKFGTSFGIKRNNGVNLGTAEGVGSAMSNVIPFPNTSNPTKVVESEVAKTAGSDAVKIAESEATQVAKKRSIIGSIGNFASDALFLGAFKGGGIGKAGTTVAEKAGGIASKLARGFTDLLPALRGFGLLLTRLTLVGGIATLAFLAIKKTIDDINQAKIDQEKSIETNLTKNRVKLSKDSNFKKDIQSRIEDLKKYGQTSQQYEQSLPSYLTGINSNNVTSSGSDYPASQKSVKLSKDEKNSQYLADQFGIKYVHDYKNGDYIQYTDGKKDENGNLRQIKAQIDNKDGSYDRFKNFINSNALSDTQKIADAWKVNTDYINTYLQDLTKIDYLSKGLSVTMKEISSSQKTVDMKFAGANSSTSLGEKIDAIVKGLSGSQDKYQEMQKHVEVLKSNYDKSNSEYNRITNKAYKSGVVGQTDIQSATDALQYAITNNPNGIDSVFKQYAQLDRNNTDDVSTMEKKGIADKNGRINDKKLEEYNNKMQAITSILTVFQTLSGFTNDYAQGQDQLLQTKDQINQYKESEKQLKSQQIIASLSLDQLSASIANLGAVASASKTLVSLSANYLQNGDNSKQISALGTSMNVSVSQMGALSQQKSVIDSEMAKLRNENPNQDFSLSQLYNPSGNVTSEQLAYKQLYEQSQQVSESISNQSSQMYDQLQQMRDLVLNSTKYADTWQRIQENIQLVKESLKQASDFTYQMMTNNSNALMKGAISGQNPYDIRQQQLSQLRDNNLDTASKLATALASSGGDAKKFQEAMDEINKNSGTEFEQSFINPLKNILGSTGSSFTQAGTTFSNSAQTFSSAVNDFKDAVGITSGASSTNIANTGTADGSMQIPSYQGVTGSEQSYLESLGFRTGTPEYISAKKQLDSMSASDKAQAINSGNYSGQYVNSINKVFAGTALAGKGSIYAQYGAQYGVDPRLMASITMAETGGNSSALTNMFNVGGIMGKNGLASYNSLDEGVQALAKLLKNNYFDKGYNTIPSIQQRYAPVGADNDPTGLNNNWVKNVSSYYSQMSGISQSQLLGGASVPTASTSASSSSGGGLTGMFGWYNSVLNNNSKMTYSWGGAHTIEDWSTFLQKAVADCSGLVEQVYRQFAGINLGTTNSQHLYSNNNGGTKVSSKSQLQPGDLVFFGSGVNNITHVGVYAGNNQMYTIDHNGTPVTKENMWSNYVGGKHFDVAGGSPSLTQTAQDTFTQMITQIVNSINAEIQTLNPTETKNASLYNLQSSEATAIGHGNVTDVLGTSGVTGKYDAIIQARQGLFDNMLQNSHQIDALNGQRSSIISQMASTKDINTYNGLKQELSSTDSLIKALQNNTEMLKDLDATYAKGQALDPRYNRDSAGGYIKAGYDTLNGNSLQFMGTNFIKAVEELNTMNSTFMTHQKQAQDLSTLWNYSGQQTSAFSVSEQQATQDNINVLFAKMQNINTVLHEFAQGTQAWFTTLSDAVKVEQQLHDLEQQRLSDAQSMFTLTGQGLQGYIKQRAYTQNLDYSQQSANMTSAINQYKSGQMDGAYGVQTGTYKDQASAQKAVDFLSKNYALNSSVTKGSDGTYRVSSDNSLTLSQAQHINSVLKTSGTSSVAYVTGSGGGPESPTQQLSNLQIISDMHDKMTQQMNDYKSAVTGAFEAGALSLDEYIKKLNDLRNVQDEAKQNAVNMMDSMKSGFQNSLSDALSQGMQGSINSPLDFMNNIKSTIASSVSGQLASTLLQNTGLQDVMNKITGSITQASTSGDPNAIVNMFNNNDFGAQIKNALAPFLPMIQQIVGSTKGIFTILKDQVYNAPSGFKIDNYMNEIASKVGYQGIKNMNPNVNDVGSPILNFPSSPPIVTTPPSSPPSGIPVTPTSPSSPTIPTTGGITPSGPPENTTGTGTPAPTSTSVSTPQPVVPVKIPSSPSTTSVGKSSTGSFVRDVQAYADTWLHKTPDVSASSRIRVLPRGSRWKMYGMKNGMVDLGGGWADGHYVYHTGGIAGVMNFQSPQGLKANELSAILQKSETVFQPRQIDDLVSGAFKAGASSGNDKGHSITVNVNIEGGGNYDKQGIETVVKTAVEKAMTEAKRQTRLGNLSWKGTSYN